ncbi:alpha/beta hydrolase [Amnibacterium kyonggiense]|uniref:Alpha/beta hydrolase family protein n=1 Tax=Amnibacterium kyonggiense TaxID=595671 RepID=A0A4R7FLM4_9MICO|nr:alpha/beta hydrolase [Amnibacterium kyonggiense]TDS77276.1 alpha/beta hydrolase family protein [Amnibacterium kyonggiense]
MRTRRVVRRVGVLALAAGVIATIGAVVWAEHPMEAEPGPLAAVEADPAVHYRDRGDAVVLTPERPTGIGLVFLAGARVDAAAYAWKLSGIADRGVGIVIVRPRLNFAILEERPLRDFERYDPAVQRWLVGGHSLGGVRACQYAADGQADGLVLLGSYCAADLSQRRIPVLSIAGSRDGLSTPTKIAAARHLLPADARLDTIDGAVHAQFGDYGKQPGDGTPTIGDAAVRTAITEDLAAFLTDPATD